MLVEQPRDDHGRFASTGGLASWAAKRSGESPGKVIAEAQTGRHWTDKLPKGMKPETWQAHFDKHPDKGGKPDAERAKLHETIIAKALEGVKSPAHDEQKVAIFTMGGPASGKSSMLKGIDSTRFVKVDPDSIKEQLPEYKQATEPGNTYRGAAKMVHEESSYIAKQVLARAIGEGKHVIVDGTGANIDSVGRKMQKLKDAGYHVHVAYSHLGDVKEAIARNKARAEKVGRFVPEEFVRRAYHDIPRNFERIARNADSFAVHDSSRAGSPVVWERTPDGKELQRDPSFVASFRSRYGRKS